MRQRCHEFRHHRLALETALLIHELTTRVVLLWAAEAAVIMMVMRRMVDTGLKKDHERSVRREVRRVKTRSWMQMQQQQLSDRSDHLFPQLTASDTLFPSSLSLSLCFTVPRDANLNQWNTRTGSCEHSTPGFSSHELLLKQRQLQ